MGHWETALLRLGGVLGPGPEGTHLAELGAASRSLSKNPLGKPIEEK